MFKPPLRAAPTLHWLGDFMVLGTEPVLQWSLFEGLSLSVVFFSWCVSSFRARGTAGLRGLEHPHFFAVIMFQIREMKEMWRKINVTKRRSKGKWDEGHEREREWSKYQKNTLRERGTVPIGQLISISNYS